MSHALAGQLLVPIPARRIYRALRGMIGKGDERDAEFEASMKPKQRHGVSTIRSEKLISVPLLLLLRMTPSIILNTECHRRRLQVL